MKSEVLLENMVGFQKDHAAQEIKEHEEMAGIDAREYMEVFDADQDAFLTLKEFQAVYRRDAGVDGPGRDEV